MSVHKSQGMTLDRVEVSLDRAFEAGMAYVALRSALMLPGDISFAQPDVQLSA